MLAFLAPRRDGGAIHAGVQEVRSSYDAKHAQAGRAGLGEAGAVVRRPITVGAGGGTPRIRHHVRYIALYKDSAEIARVYLHPVFRPRG
jgi:hypothetical protein